MDERAMKKCIGKPVPEWDLAHRLSIDRAVGPDVKDFGSTFSINSIFMDVIEPSFLEKQWFVSGVVFAFLCVGIGPYIYWLTHIKYSDAADSMGDVFSVCVSLGFLFLAWKFGRGLFFGLRYRPIRFHRAAHKIFSIRTRRFSLKPGDGDVVWEAPWTEDSIFCLHRENTSWGTIFHIRHYTIDEHGNVTRVFSIGREWTGRRQVEMALAQWNYWCMYMNAGPNGLPKPMLFHTRHETLRESFLFSLYSFGMRAPVVIRLLMMPLILVFTVMRVFANMTCRNPVWPGQIENISVVASDDPYAEPRAGTPVGWGDTVLAQQRGEYPNDPKTKADGWVGEPDGRANAASWLDNPSPKAKHATVRS
ncbi:DUF6708 domain-containing protein [Burkholderia sp. Cy-637]|uniref:DUF6708 domain-containing protein n=1 Tax=Burkholderia sp. Cy-637 TaxID=2608327 RepID=UPI00142304BA|nr:DUF6708 domain-containing protein [Burkholderia sp. Cy-637]NIF90638.1 hypothetical protein [Burkholderia sp. Cy-637]